MLILETIALGWMPGSSVSERLLLISQPENNSPLSKHLWGIKCATAHQFYSQTFMQTSLAILLDVCLEEASNMEQLSTQGKPIQVPATNIYKHLSI